MSLRKVARASARSKSYADCRTTDMFRYFFSKGWREKGYPANLKKHNSPGPTKKGHRPKCVK